MAITANCQWETQAGVGNDANGGGYVSGGGGTDYSQQASPQWALTSISTSGATATINYTSSATAMIGNVVQVISGTNFTTGFYQITGVVVGTSFTVDRNLTTGAGSSGVLNIGGCFATLAGAAAASANQGYEVMVFWFKATATYTISTGVTFSGGVANNPLLRFIGYTSTRGDGGSITVQPSAAITTITLSWYVSLENFILNGNSTGTQGVSVTGRYNQLYNVVAHHFTAEGIIQSEQCTIYVNCSVYNCGGTNGSFVPEIAVLISCYCYNAKGFYSIAPAPATTVFIDCVAYNNTGWGFYTSGFICSVTRCVAANNSLGGIYSNLAQVTNCILVGNTGYGIYVNFLYSAVPGSPLFLNNAFYSNSSGNYSNSGYGYTNGGGLGDIILTGNPFNNPSSNDFSLNNTAGAGAACRAAGFPGVAPFGTGYIDIGALQSQSTGGTTSYFPILVSSHTDTQLS